MVAPVSPKPQTTRIQQRVILTHPNAQLIFVDTPGIHKPLHKLGEAMNEDANAALANADLVLAVFDMSMPPTDDDARVAERILDLSSESRVLTVLNKMDLVSPEALQERWAAFEALIPDAEVMGISATRGDNLQALLEKVISHLPEGPRYYDENEITETFERDIAADLIRTAALRRLRDEVPHSVAVRIDEYIERGERGAYIAATLFVERESQKGIVIGKGGSMLREIGTLARLDIEQMSGRRVYLDLRVKLLPGWRNDEKALKRFGYKPPSSRSP